MELTKVYNPAATEQGWYDLWEKQGYFGPFPQSPRGPFAIVIPPPNVTGSLHMGHALNNTLQDILIRWRRMQGYKTLWVPGTDHGGIATQNIVEKLIQKEGKSRNDLGREAFLSRMWQWRQESGDTILMQLKRLGASCDWSRTRFTMDQVCSRAVLTAFVQLFQKGLIYRGLRMVNWCPRDHTALSDIEVEHEERAGKLWHIRYPLTEVLSSESKVLREKGSTQDSGLRTQDYIVVATTRPETMLGDTAVAVNPEDPRYQALIGKTLRLPLMNRQIPVIADAAVDPRFGTGAVKVTPAHDVTDFEIGARHKLDQVVVIDFHGKMTDQAGVYAHLDRFEARRRIVADLEAQGLIEKVEDYRVAVAVCYRCLTVIEPLVSEQWFLSMKAMAERAAEATRQGKVRIFPSSWEKPYLQWLENIKDWCISRQIWWGHRIPVWYCPKSEGRRARGDRTVTPLASPHSPNVCPPIASVEKPTKCPSCGSTDLTQDEDVLDTWFSSALWPFSVFGWPDDTPDLKTFYPTTVLVTGHEILYLWVARMVMMGLEFLNKVPFRHVYIHGIIRDKHGKKMSKSLGNVIDPLVIMKQYGTDALRFALSSSSVPGRDQQLSDDAFLKARNFANKLWNASRFVRMNLDGYRPQPIPKERELADRWILHDLQHTIEQVDQALESYNPAEASRVLYEFLWGSYCDWYLEIVKPALARVDEAAKTAKQAVLVNVLEKALALLHPFMPYETEALFDAFKPFINHPAPSLMIHPWPAADPQFFDTEAAGKMELVKDVVTSIRTLRSESVIPPGKKIKAYIDCEDRIHQTVSDPNVLTFINFLGRLERAEFQAPQTQDRKRCLITVFNGGEIFIPAEGLIDMAKERSRLQKNLLQAEQMLRRGAAQLVNVDFLEHAPAEEVDRLRSQTEQLKKKTALLKRNLEGFS